MPFKTFTLWQRAFVSAFVFLLAFAGAHAVDVTLEWDANTEPDLAGYRVHYGTVSGTYDTSIDAGNDTRITIQELATGATYYFVATAYNTAGLESPPSEEVNFTAGSGVNQAPTVTLTGPVNGTAFVAPATVTLTADAADADGTVSRVEFFSGPTKLGEDTVSPFSFAWQNVPAGTYQLTAVAWDDRGATATSATVTISIAAPNQPPTVALTNPVVDAAFTAPASIFIAAGASDPDGSVARVEFFSGNVKLGEAVTAPFQMNWNDVAAGTYTLTAVAWDQQGASTTSAPLAVTVNAPPTLALATNGTSFVEPASITMNAAPSDSDGRVVRVEFYQGANKLGEQNAAPFSWTWAFAPAGTYLLRARAVDDRGAAAWSNEISVTVLPENQLPVVALTSPETGAFYHQPATISLAAAAQDTDGTINRVEYFAGSVRIATSMESPFAAEWTDAPPGTHSLTAVAYDDRGGSGVSAAITVTVNAAPQVSVSVSSMKLAAGGSLTIEAIASDPDGVVKRVQFYSGTILLGKDMNSPYKFTWNKVPAGTHVITAVAYDNQGAVTQSTPVNVEVTPSAQRESTAVALPTVQLLGFGYEGAFEMNIVGRAGDIYDVWSSEDLKQWSLFISVLNPDGNVLVSDPTTSNGRRFYRVSVR